MDKELGELQALMLRSWDERVAFDSLGWMNEPVQSHAQLVETGRRDFFELFSVTELVDMADKRVLDLGCGIGRIALEAGEHFEQVLGVDISPAAIDQAQRLRARENIDFELNDGLTLKELAAESFDFVYSFGVLSNVPVRVCAGYLGEIARVLRLGGEARLLLFMGKCETTVEDDATAFRSFKRDNIKTAVELLGFNVLSTRKPYTLPERVLNDGWLLPHVVALQKCKEASAAMETVAEVLYPKGECRADEQWPGSHTEFLLSALRAEEFAKRGDARRARDTLRFALERYSKPEPAIVRALEVLEERCKNEVSIEDVI